MATKSKKTVRANSPDLHPAKIIVDGKGKVRVFVSPKVAAKVKGNPKARKR